VNTVGSLRRHFASARFGLERALAPLGSVDALSWPVLVIYCPLAIVIQAPGNASIYGGSVTLWVLASLIGMVALAAILLGARAIASRRRETRPGMVLATYALAGVVQSVTFGLASVLVGAADSPQIAFRLFGLILHFPLLVAVGYAVSGHASHRRILSDLERTRARSLALARSADGELERGEAELSGAVRASLEPALVSFETALEQAEGGSPARDVARSLDSLVEEHIRPLSHQIASDEASSIPEIPVEEPRVRVPLPPRFRLSEGIRPLLTALVVFITAIPTATRELSSGEAIAYVAALPALVFLALSLLRRLVGALRLPTPVGAVATILFYAAIGSAAFWLVGAIGLARPSGIVLSVTAVFTLLGAVIVADLLVQSRRQHHEVELEQEVDRLDESLALIRRRERLIRRRLAFVLHGSLQGTLHAAVLKISEAPEVQPELVEEIRRDLAAALSQLDGSPRAGESTRTGETIDELSSVWNGSRQVTATVGPPADRALAEDADADEAVAEVIREAVNNAFRHGDATKVDIELGFGSGPAAGGSRRFAIAVRDDGSGDWGEGTSGLGSTLLDELCISWDRESGEEGTLLRAVVALRPMVGESVRRGGPDLTGDESCPVPERTPAQDPA
jgi:signal transduction histidine kinase